jgi:hypothetical protein
MAIQSARARHSAVSSAVSPATAGVHKLFVGPPHVIAHIFLMTKCHQIHRRSSSRHNNFVCYQIYPCFSSF